MRSSSSFRPAWRDPRRTGLSEAVARAKADIVAAFGLNATVIQDYYAIANALNENCKSAQTSVQNEASRLSGHYAGCRRQGGESAHSDVIKALLQSKAARPAIFRTPGLPWIKPKSTLAVLIFPTLQQNYRHRG